MDAPPRARGDRAARRGQAADEPGELQAGRGAAQASGQGSGPLGRPSRQRAGWAGIGAGQAGAAARDPGPHAVGTGDLREPGARLGQRRAVGHRRQRRAEGPVAVAAPGRRVDLLLLAHRAAFRRVGSDADHHLGPAGRRRVRDRRAQVVRLERLGRRLRARHGRDRTGRIAVRARLHVRDRAGHAWYGDGAQRAHDGPSLSRARGTSMCGVMRRSGSTSAGFPWPI